MHGKVKKKTKRVALGIIALLVIVAITLTQFGHDVYAFSCKTEKKATTYDKGWFWLIIQETDGDASKGTKCEVDFKKNSDGTFACSLSKITDLNNASGNYNNVKLSTTSVSLKQDNENKNTILVVQLTFTQHANQKYSSWWNDEVYASSQDYYAGPRSGGRFSPSVYAKAGGGALSVPQDVVDADTIQTLTISAHYANAGLATFDSGGAHYRTNGREMYLTYSRPSYTVKFYDGNNVVKEQSVAHGAGATAPTLSKTGYTYKWNTGYSKITKDTDVKANWTANSYAVKYDSNGGTGNAMDDSTFTYDKDGTLRKNTYTKTGYEFKGWNTESDGSGTSYADGATVKNLAASGTVTLYAQWKASDYTISFQPNGGTGSMGDQTGQYGVDTALNAVNFARPGYTFAGWSTDAESTNGEYADRAIVNKLANPGETATLYAIWKKTDASFDTDTLIHDDQMFAGDGNIRGENGTTYDKNHTDSSYAKVDRDSDPGYFTERK